MVLGMSNTALVVLSEDVITLFVRKLYMKFQQI